MMFALMIKVIKKIITSMMYGLQIPPLCCLVKTLDAGVRVSTPHNHFIGLDSGQLLLGILRRFSLGTQLIWESPAYRWIPIIELSLLNG